MNILITGCSGLVGNALVEYLFAQGHSIQCLKRNKPARPGRFWAIDTLPNREKNFEGVIHLAGENVAENRWTASVKKEILRSRVDGTRELVDFLASLPHKPRVFLCASGVGYYGSRGDRILDENSPSGGGFLADVCRQWERETDRLRAMDVRVVYLRFGMVLSPKGGTLHKMLGPFKSGFGGVVGSGGQYISWISIRDTVAVVDFLLSKPGIEGPVNIVSPIAATNREFTESLGRALDRPILLNIPEFIAKISFGQIAEETLLSSIRVTPKVLLENDYHFRDQSLDAVLRFCLFQKSEDRGQKPDEMAS